MLFGTVPTWRRKCHYQRSSEQDKIKFDSLHSFPSLFRHTFHHQILPCAVMSYPRTWHISSRVLKKNTTVSGCSPPSHYFRHFKPENETNKKTIEPNNNLLYETQRRSKLVPFDFGTKKCFLAYFISCWCRQYTLLVLIVNSKGRDLCH